MIIRIRCCLVLSALFFPVIVNAQLPPPVSYCASHAGGTLTQEIVTPIGSNTRIQCFYDVTGTTFAPSVDSPSGEDLIAGGHSLTTGFDSKRQVNGSYPFFRTGTNTWSWFVKVNQASISAYKLELSVYCK